MKRSATVAILSVGFTIASAVSAFAANYPPTPNGGGGGTSGSGGSSGLASTGGDVTLGMVLVVALLAIGLTALLIGRRRARA